jgi:hypoxanthine phosphoribosyltransferase
VAANLSYDLPDCVVGLARGGLIPSVLLSNTLGISMECINLSLRDSKVSGSVELFEAQLKNLDKYKNIAVVDDICDSGKTFHVLDIHLHDRGHRNIKWCALMSKTSSMFEPTIVGEMIHKANNSDWIVFPWEG